MKMKMKCYAVKDYALGTLVTCFQAKSLADAVHIKHQLEEAMRGEFGRDLVFSVAEITRREFRALEKNMELGGLVFLPPEDFPLLK